MSKVIICQEKFENRTDSFWYNGLIAELGKFRLYAVGEIRVNFPEDEENTYREFRAVEHALSLDYTDEDLLEVDWIHNNWFEVGWVEGDTLEFDMGIVADNYDDAIELLKNYYNGDMEYLGESTTSREV